MDLKISLVLPIYNVEKYLSRCIESTLNQDLSKELYEIILVNDGSKDHSLNICKHYEQIAPNVILIDKENGGLSSARNAGLEKAKGTYIWFIDSDDEIEKNCLSALMQEIEKKDLDYLEFPYKNIYSNHTYTKSSLKAKPNDVCSGIELISKYLIGIPAWSGISKRSIWIDNNIRFLEGIYAEDLQCTIRLMKHIKKYAFFNQNIYPYLYGIRDGSISRNNNNDHIRKYLLSYFKILESWQESFNLDSKNKSDYDYWVNRKYLNYLKCCMLSCLFRSSLPAEERKHYFERFKKENIFLDNLRGRIIGENFSSKIFYRTIALSPTLYKYALLHSL
ncbi:glycosyltransferase [Porphyromonas macacae]|uniref:Hyaluronan synthase n=1 Tax=Porphyromonas macacae TaxID=28115 RepID=A0A379DFU9_9PORP|nr:glycosyltransferase [Porphyromonas macacae]SUB77219.1 Hyaluronan synthase [Porphyromonas macacae]